MSIENGSIDASPILSLAVIRDDLNESNPYGMCNLNYQSWRNFLHVRLSSMIGSRDEGPDSRGCRHAYWEARRSGGTRAEPETEA